MAPVLFRRVVPCRVWHSLSALSGIDIGNHELATAVRQWFEPTPTMSPETTEDHDAPETLSDPENVAPADPSEPASSQHHTLKYSLLGPSLTKAGQDSVDQKKVSEIIYNASKGSKFFNNEEARDRNLTEKINRILAKKQQLDKLDLSHELRRADEYIAELELSRDLSQVVVHIDCDAFYAAVEECTFCSKYCDFARSGSD